jgi:hypothetical protein
MSPLLPSFSFTPSKETHEVKKKKSDRPGDGVKIQKFKFALVYGGLGGDAKIKGDVKLSIIYGTR